MTRVVGARNAHSPIGRKTRIVPTAIKRALMARDKSCAFPGCHHKLVHEVGFTIERDYQNHWFFRRPDGRAVPNCGYHAQDMMDDDVGDLSATLSLLALAQVDPASPSQVPMGCQVVFTSCVSRIR